MKDWLKKRLAHVQGLYSLASRINHGSITLFFYGLRIFAINPRKIVFTSWYGRGYNDNGKYITKGIIDQKLDYELVWLLKDPARHQNLPSEVRPVKYGTLKSYYEMATARVWVDNSRQHSYVKKRRGQYYIQTWHSALALKKHERDAESELPPEYVRAAKEDSRKVDLFLLGVDQDIDEVKRCYWYEGEVLSCGTPMLDIYFNTSETLKKSIRERLQIPANSKIAIYVPTFRKDHSLDVYNMDYQRCISALRDRFGGEWVMLLRLHPDMVGQNFQTNDMDNVRDVSSYDDVQEIVCISDVMISDYSGLMFEAAVKRTPCFLYASDLDEYLNDDRGSALEMSNLPFSIATSNEELVRDISTFDQEKYDQKVAEFWQRVGFKQDGTASKQVVERIKQVVAGKYANA